MNITDAELKELRVSRKLFSDWYRVLNHLYNAGRRVFKEDCKEGENVILVKSWEIRAIFMNSKYIQVEVWNKDICYLEMRYAGNVKPIIMCVYEVIIETKI